MREYLAKFSQGDNPISTNAIDFYREDGEIIKHEWAMGGESKTVVDSVPSQIDGYRCILIEGES